MRNEVRNHIGAPGAGPIPTQSYGEVETTTIRVGETRLWQVAQRLGPGVSAEALRELNPQFANRDQLTPGLEIRIPLPATEGRSPRQRPRLGVQRDR